MDSRSYAVRFEIILQTLPFTILDPDNIQVIYGLYIGNLNRCSEATLLEVATIKIGVLSATFIPIWQMLQFDLQYR